MAWLWNRPLRRLGMVLVLCLLFAPEARALGPMGQAWVLPPVAAGFKGNALSMDKQEVTIQKGALYQIRVTAEPGDSDPRIRWKSGNPAVASVAAYDGIVRGKKAGVANITGSVAGGGKLSCRVIVKAVAETPAERFAYTVGDSGAIVTGYDDPDQEMTVVVPATLGGHPVVEIGDLAFHPKGRSLEHINKIILPDSVQKIGSYAFVGCSLWEIKLSDGLTSIGKGAFYENIYLTSVTIPKGVTRIEDETFYTCAYLRNIKILGNITSIGRYAFAFCNLRKVTIGKGVQSIGDGAFAYNNLTSFTVSSANPYYSERGGVLFNKDQTRLIMYPPRRSASSYAIPKSVVAIGDSAFTNCHNLKTISMPNKVTYLGRLAFFNCTKLKNVKLSSGLTIISQEAFSDCVRLKKIEIPEGVVEIDKEAFRNDDQNPGMKIYLPRSITKIAPRRIGPNTVMSDYPFDDGVVLYVYADSYAMRYAIDNRYDYVIR